MKKLYLIDGMSLVFRAYHAMHGARLITPSGDPSGAVFGFVNIITSFLERENPEYLAVVFDTKEPTFRHEMYKEYKANRDAFPEELVPQLASIKELLDHLSIKRIEMPGYEADDVIGTLAKRAAEENIPAICLTSDKDYLQLVDDYVAILKPAGKGGEFELISYEGVKDKFGVVPEKVIDVMALIGDTSDNIPGVKGIGEKTAIPLINEYGSLEDLYHNVDKIERKAVKDKLINNKDNAFLSKKLVTIDVNVPYISNIEDFKLPEADFVKLDLFFEKQGFNTIRNKWRQKAVGADFSVSVENVDKLPEINTVHDTITETSHKYLLIDDIDNVKSLAAELENAVEFAFDLETSSLEKMDSEIVGIAISLKEGEAYYIPVDDRLDGKETKQINTPQIGMFEQSDKGNEIPVYSSSLPTKAVLKILRPLLENDNIGKIGQNAKFDTFLMKRYGIDVSPITFDTMLASYLIDPEAKHNLDALSKGRLNYTPVPISSLIGEKKSEQRSMKEIDPKEISDYACEDADLALKLKNIMYKELEKEGLLKLAEDIEFPIVEVLTQMEYNGVVIDSDSLNEISGQISEQTAKLTDMIFKEAGTDFNIDSPQQLGHILFEKLMIPPIKKTKTGYSTDVQVLSYLSPTYPIADMVLEYRQLQKLKSTYVDALPKLVCDSSGRIHTTYNQTVASTGRLSSVDPNLQNIPIRTDAGKEIRKAFIPGDKDRVILSADYSQVELRIMAHICGDQALIDAFRNGHDIHAATAAKLNNIDISDVTQDMRRIAKTVNFGIMYGLGAFGLSQRLGLSRTQSKEIIDNYFEKYPGIRKYIDMTIKSCKKKGYAETLCGRRRHFPNINSKNRNLSNAAERGAINMPIQGTASDMMKIAMISIYKEMKKRGMKSLMTMQVHDELVFDTLKSELDELRSLVIDKMESALPLGEVPVVVDTGTGNNWLEAH